MAVLRYTSAGPSATTLLVVNGSADTGYSLLEGSDFSLPTFDLKYSGQRGTQGARIAQAVPKNRAVRTLLRVYGSTPTERNQRVEALLELWYEMQRQGGQIFWQGSAETYGVTFDVLGVEVGREAAMKRWESRLLALLVADFSVAPFALGAPCDILEDFSSDTLTTDYTRDAGSAGDDVVTGGVLDAVNNLTVERRYAHTVKGYQFRQVAARLKFTPGATITSFKAGVVLKRVSATTYLEIYVDDTGAASRLRIDEVVSGARNNLASTNLSARVSNGTPGWIQVVWLQQNGLRAEYWTKRPDRTSGTYDVNATTTGINAALGRTVAGYSGIVWIPQHTAANLDDFEVLPFTIVEQQMAAVPIPGPIQLGDPIPGSAPALADVLIANGGGSQIPVWCILGWSPHPPTYNYVWNGSFEREHFNNVVGNTPEGWSVAAVTGVTGAATSIQVNGTLARCKFGTQNGQIVTPATANTGASFRVVRRFQAGVTYTASLYASAASSVTNTRIRLGVSGDIASETPTALTTTPTLRTVTWTPIVSTSEAYVAFEVTAATGTTMNIDAVQVYEGVTAPTWFSQIEGRGAPPPLGALPAINVETFGTFAATSSANYHFGAGYQATMSGQGSGYVSWLIDPSLLTPDDYALAEVDVELWCMVYIGSGAVLPRLTLLAESIVGSTGVGGGVSYPAEFGSSGTLVQKPSTGTALRFVRLGTIGMAIDPKYRSRWRLTLEGSWQAGSTGTFGIDFLYCLPAKARCLGATGKVKDTSYPSLFHTGNDEERIYRSTLSGLYGQSTGSTFHPDSGLGGAMIELPAGGLGTDLTFRFGSEVPDDPVANGDTDRVQSSFNPTTRLHLAVTPRWFIGRDA